ncbi:MAG: hypothetical protein ABW110_13625 [Steroidobacteraceae bacterium]
MSTLAYAQLTNKRESAPAPTGTSSVRTYVDTLAALVPAEVLTMHAVLLNATTTKIAKGTSLYVPKTAEISASVDTLAKPGVGDAIPAGGGAIIDPTKLDQLQIAFWVLIVLSLLFFIIPRVLGGKWDRYDLARMSIAPLAFVGWTMLQPATAFDAAFPDMDATLRLLVALVIGASLALVTPLLAKEAESKALQPIRPPGQPADLLGTPEPKPQI